MKTKKCRFTAIAICLLISFFLNSAAWSGKLKDKFGKFMDFFNKNATPKATLCRKIVVDFSTKTGDFNRLSGVQGSPWPIIKNDRENIDGFKAHKIEICRFPQDCYPNTMTLGGIFKNENANPTLFENYDFTLIDKHVDAARKAGCNILWQTSYDIGKTDQWKGINLGGRPIKDVQKWKKVVTKCLEHFNNGWKDGFTYAVKYVEFLNEPIGLGGFLGEQMPRAPKVFMEFLKCINEYNNSHPDTQVIAVGPGLPTSIDLWDKFEDRFKTLFTILKNKGIPLPVFSFHTYGKDVSPAGNYRLAANYRKLLDQAGMVKTKLWNSEWQAGDFLRKIYNINYFQIMKNANPYIRLLYRKAMASYALSCKIRWQDDLDYSCYYIASKRAFPPNIEEKLKEIKAYNEGPFFKTLGNAQPLAMQESLSYWVSKNIPLRCKTQLKDFDDSMITALGLKDSRGNKTAILVCSMLKDPQKIEIAFIPPKNEQNHDISKIVSTIKPLEYFDMSSNYKKTDNLKITSSLQFSKKDRDEQKKKLYKYSLQKPKGKSKYWKATLTIPPCETLLIELENL